MRKAKGRARPDKFGNGNVGGLARFEFLCIFRRNSASVDKEALKTSKAQLESARRISLERFADLAFAKITSNLKSMDYRESVAKERASRDKPIEVQLEI